MNPHEIESKPDTRTRAERRAPAVRYYKHRYHTMALVRSSEASGGYRLPFDEFKYSSLSRYEPHVGKKQEFKAWLREAVQWTRQHTEPMTPARFEAHI